MSFLTSFVESHRKAMRVPPAFIGALCVMFAVLVFVCVLQLAQEHVRQEEELKAAATTKGAAGASPGSGASLHHMPVERHLTSSAQMPERAPSFRAHHGGTPMMGRSPMPSQRVIPPPAPPLASTSKHLCPGLVVPHGNECILAVPSVVATKEAASGLAILDVQDLEGKSVIKAEVSSLSAARESSSRPLIILRAGIMQQGSQPQPRLAYSKAATDAGSQKIVQIYDTSDQLFGQVVQDTLNGRYVFSTGRANFQLFFEFPNGQGDLRERAVTVTNDQNLRIADTQPSIMAFNPTGSYYKLRVVSNVDVGLILSALFAIDCMELA